MNPSGALSEWVRSMRTVCFSRNPNLPARFKSLNDDTTLTTVLHVPSQTLDLPATFESLNDDTLRLILKFVGNKSYKSFGGLDKRCKEVYLNTPGMTKETFVFGYAPLAVITDKIERAGHDLEFHKRVGKGVVLYNRRDVMDWALQRQNKCVLNGIFKIAIAEGKTELLVEVWNNIEDDDDKRYIFGYVDSYAARGGKLNVLKWLETKGLYINKYGCAGGAAIYGHLHILKFLKEEKGLELNGELYFHAIKSGHMHVMKWLREQGCPFHVHTFYEAAKKGNLEILQWLHDEGCPWPEDDYYRVYEHRLKPEALEWCRMNGYGDRIM